MHATLERFRFESNFAEYGSGDFRVDWFATMRCTGERDLLVSETETVSRTGSYQRNRLMWFRRRTEIRHGFRGAEVGGNGAIRFNCHDVAAMPRFCDSASRHLNQRLSC